MTRRSLFRSPRAASSYFLGDFGCLRRSRKPVWAFRSIGGSNPPSPLVPTD
jgi:hypothetical protein